MKMVNIQEGNNILSASNSQRNTTLDIMKGIGIILVVLGHCNIKEIEHFIGLFHMPFFFIASGYCWNEKNAESLTSVYRYFLKKIQSLWIPFAVGNGIFSILHNFFLKVNIYTSDPGICILYPSMATRLKSHVELQQIVQSVIKNILFAGDTQLGGATWFLRTLFTISVVHVILRYIAKHWKHGKTLYCICIGAAFVGAQLISNYSLQFPMGIHTCFSSYAVFCIGIYLRKIDFHKKVMISPFMIFCAFAILIILNNFGSINASGAKITNVIFYLVCSLAGWFLLWGISERIQGCVADFLKYCGQHSIWIVVLHFLTFKLVSLAYICFTGSEYYVLSIFPAIRSGLLWVAYLAVGTTVPLLVRQLFLYCAERIRGMLCIFK